MALAWGQVSMVLAVADVVSVGSARLSLVQDDRLVQAVPDEVSLKSVWHKLDLVQST